MSAIVDTYITYRIIKTLVTPWDEQDAYKLGIINDKGKVLKKYRELKTSKEKAAYTVLIRFVFNLKRILNQVPGGKSKFGSYATAAVLLLKEEEENEKEIL
jgi:1,2-phenylacetyl-CoA epoxidase catalytic subunit